MVNSIVLSSSRAHSQFAYKDPRIVRNRNQPVQAYEVLVQLFKSESVFGIFSPHLAVHQQTTNLATWDHNSKQA